MCMLIEAHMCKLRGGYNEQTFIWVHQMLLSQDTIIFHMYQISWASLETMMFIFTIVS